MLNIYYIFFILITTIFFFLHMFSFKYMLYHFDYSIFFVKLTIMTILLWAISRFFILICLKYFINI